MIRFVFLVDPFTVLGVRLSEPPVVIMPLNLLDARPSLTFEILAHKVLKWSVIIKNLLVSRHLIRTHRKEL
jgi:hypothetical protein